MAYDTLHPIDLSDEEKDIELYLECFEMTYPGVLAGIVSVAEALREMPKEKTNEI